MHLPALLKNAIEVNRSTKYAIPGRPYGHVLLAVYSDQDGAYVVRMVVEHNTSKATAALLDFGVVGRLRAVNAKEIPSSNGWQPSKNGSPRNSRGYRVSITDLVDAVKTQFPDTFAEGVYKKSGMQRSKTPFSEHLQFYLPDDPLWLTQKPKRQRLLSKNGLVIARL